MFLDLGQIHRYPSKSIKMMVLDGISIILYHPRLNLAQGVHPGPDLICKEYKKGVGKFNEIF
jgi:hypothetical protein